ncbi:MAG: 2-succinyl-5-enolpyruvyl-6-hydroxy-3-cyclohexene-1-carboxylate synthase [Bacteroidia bacterium]|jgi:2-succinyl-5-enolpyruvyl-6-hydroxy-3-cyclohexene-1-carboxylate synthase
MEYQTTPHAYEADKLAEHFGLGYFKADTIGKFAQGYDMLSRSEGAFILEVQNSKESNRAFFEQFKNV